MSACSLHSLMITYKFFNAFQVNCYHFYYSYISPRVYCEYYNQNRSIQNYHCKDKTSGKQKQELRW